MRLRAGRDWLQFLSTAIESAHDGVVLFDLPDPQGEFVYSYVNAAFEEQTGYRRDELIGKTNWDLYGPQTDMAAGARLNLELRAGRACSGELLKYRRDGSTIWVELNMRPLLGDDGQLIGAVSIQRDISARKSAEASLRKTRALLDGIMENTDSVVYAKDVDGRYLLINKRFEEWHGVQQRDFLGKTDYEIFPRAVADALRENDRLALEAGSSIVEEERVTTHDGRLRTVLSVKFTLRDESGVPYATCGMSTDVTESSATRTQLELLTQALDQASDGIGLYEYHAQNGRFEIVYANEMLTRSTGYGIGELRGKTSDIFNGARTDLGLLEESRARLRDGETVRGEYVLYKKNGDSLWVEVNSRPILENGAVKYVVAVYRDVTQKHLREEQLSYEASHDPLTGAYNRRFLIQSVETALHDVRRRDAVHGFVMLDLDGFKPVNDTYGHEAGDRLLVALTILLSSRLRRGDILARLGGDEFAILLLGCSAEQTRSIAAELIEAIAGYSLPWNGARLTVRASAGIASINLDCKDALDVLRNADDACYRAKRAGKNQVAAG